VRVSTHVSGARDLDGKFSKMMAVKLACDAVPVDYPLEVKQYFGMNADDGEEHLRKEMASVDISGAVLLYNEDGAYGYEVDLSKLSDEAKKIRFESSWQPDGVDMKCAACGYDSRWDESERQWLIGKVRFAPGSGCGYAFLERRPDRDDCTGEFCLYCGELIRKPTCWTVRGRMRRHNGRHYRHDE